MTFKVGETVVYPHHGAALIEAIETRMIKGEEKAYLRLRVAQGDLTLMVPTDKLEDVGVRDVVDQNGLDQVFEVLRAEYTEEPTNWSRRYKANLEKLASGNVIRVAEVVRDLWRRDRERGLSAGEKRMLGKARQILVSELALAECTNEDKAESILDEVLPGTVMGAPKTVKEGLAAFMEKTQADELIIAAGIFDHAKRLKSYEIAARLREEMSGNK